MSMNDNTHEAKHNGCPIKHGDPIMGHLVEPEQACLLERKRDPAGWPSEGMLGPLTISGRGGLG